MTFASSLVLGVGSATEYPTRRQLEVPHLRTHGPCHGGFVRIAVSAARAVRCVRTQPMGGPVYLTEGTLDPEPYRFLLTK